ncbi:MAG: DUF1365 family protein [Candidatus Omnitrophota bacterium]|jgi:DUF1365 family protein
MNSCLYECNVMHHRVEPKDYKFSHRVFYFYLDLDELDKLSSKNKYFSHNQSGIFSFYDEDHINFGSENICKNIETYVKENGIEQRIDKIMLLTNVRVFGYIFNPVCFYYCFDEKGQPLCVVTEICNTFKEIKPFFMGPETLQEGAFISQQKKYFYISPFIELDVPMDFKIKIPNNSLDIRIDDLKQKKKFLYTALVGTRKELNNTTLLWYGIKYPFVTLKTIFLIHYHAAILHFIKNIPYHKKDAKKHLQKGQQNEYVKK